MLTAVQVPVTHQG